MFLKTNLQEKKVMLDKILLYKDRIGNCAKTY